MVYYFLWVFFVYVMLSRPKTNEPVCDFSPLLIVYLFLLGFICSVVLLVKFLATKNETNSDYMLFTGMVMLPMIISLLYIMRYSS